VPSEREEAAMANKERHKQRLRKAWEVFDRTGDGSQFLEHFADDVVYHVGVGPFAGDHRGKDAIAQLFSRLQEMTGGSARSRLHALLFDEDHSVALAENRFSANGEEFPIKFAWVSHVRDDDMIDEIWMLTFEQPDLEEVLGRVRAQGKRPGTQ
jgi:ketosteroid isomerase-like protein